MEDLLFTTKNALLHYGVKGMKWGVINSEYEPVNKPYGGRQKNVTGKANAIEKKGEGLKTGKVGSTSPEAAKAHAQTQTQTQTRSQTIEKIDDGYEERKQEYIKVSNDLDRYEKAFKSIEDMDPKYSEKLFKRYSVQLQDLVDRHQEVMGYKPRKVNNANDMINFFKFYHEMRKAEGYA